MWRTEQQAVHRRPMAVTGKGAGSKGKGEGMELSMKVDEGWRVTKGMYG